MQGVQIWSLVRELQGIKWVKSDGSQRVGHDWVTELNWTDRELQYSCLENPMDGGAW